MRKCIAREIIKEVPGVQTVVLPDHWFDDLNDGHSVFRSLYEWMLKSGRIPAENKESLHDRTYVGEKLYKRLRAEEKKRLNKKLKIKGKELDRALDWSDMNSGPRTEIGGCSISGEVMLVIPESSKEALGEFSSKIFDKVREAEIKKIRDSAAGGTFYHWLLSHLDRPDHVGDLARDAAADKSFPQGSDQYEEIKSYMDSQGACEGAIESLKDSWLEYLQQYPERVRVYAWCSKCGKRIDVEDALLAWSSESQELFVIDVACHSKDMTFDEMASRPLAGIPQVELEELVEKEEVSGIEVEDLLERLKLWGVIPVVIKGCVYFIKSEGTKAIKIGFTAGQVERRLSSLQTAHPYKLKLLATIPGARENEKSLKEQFARYRLEGEWFEPHPDLLAFISVIAEG